jgi:hypothetical protein
MTNAELLAEVLEKVKKYDPKPDEELLAALVARYAVVFRNADAKYVSCSERSELERVKKSFLLDRLKVDLDDAKMDELLAEICEQMKRERRKHRGVFYYLLTKKLGKRDAFV